MFSFLLLFAMDRSGISRDIRENTEIKRRSAVDACCAKRILVPSGLERLRAHRLGTRRGLGIIALH